MTEAQRRERNAQRAKEFRDEARRSGLCIGCSKISPEPGGSLCRFCKELRKRSNRDIKIEALRQYGGVCACCGEHAVILLDLDHKNNDGAKQRQKHGYKTGMHFYRWLKRNGWPKDLDLQVLCVTCNQSKARNGGECHHQAEQHDMLTKLAKIPLTY